MGEALAFTAARVINVYQLDNLDQHPVVIGRREEVEKRRGHSKQVFRIVSRILA